jgi:hypothetical protein
MSLDKLACIYAVINSLCEHCCESLNCMRTFYNFNNFSTKNTFRKLALKLSTTANNTQYMKQ